MLVIVVLRRAAFYVYVFSNFVYILVFFLLGVQDLVKQDNFSVKKFFYFWIGGYRTTKYGSLFKFPLLMTRDILYYNSTVQYLGFQTYWLPNILYVATLSRYSYSSPGTLLSAAYTVNWIQDGVVEWCRMHTSAALERQWVTPFPCYRKLR